MTTQQESRQAAEDSEIAEIRRIGENAQARRLSRAFMQTADDLPRMFELTNTELMLVSDLTLVYGQEVDPEDLEAVERREQAIERLSAELAVSDTLVIRKIERYIHVLESQDMMVENFKKRAKRLRDHASAIENGQARLKQRLLDAMRAMERDSVATPAGVVTIRKNNPSVNVVDASAIPAEFQRTTVTVEPNKTAILSHTKATGELVPGVVIVRTERIEIR